MVATLKTFFIILICLLVSSPSWSSDPLPEMVNARAMAMGGAVTSLSGKTMSARANPAGLAVERGYFVGASYLNRDTNQFDAVTVTLVDNQTATIAGALQYTRLITKYETEEVGLSFAGGARSTFWGFTTRFVHGRESDDDDWDNAIVGDVGLLISYNFV